MFFCLSSGLYIYKLSLFLAVSVISTAISFSSFVPEIHPYGTSQTCRCLSHRPPTALTCFCKAVSFMPIFRETIVPSGYLAGGGVHSVSLTMISTVLYCLCAFASCDSGQKSGHRRTAQPTSLSLFALVLKSPVYSLTLRCVYIFTAKYLAWLQEIRNSFISFTH